MACAHGHVFLILVLEWEILLFVCSCTIDTCHVVSCQNKNLFVRKNLPTKWVALESSWPPLPFRTGDLRASNCMPDDRHNYAPMSISCPMSRILLPQCFIWCRKPFVHHVNLLVWHLFQSILLVCQIWKTLEWKKLKPQWQTCAGPCIWVSDIILYNQVCFAKSHKPKFEQLFPEALV